MKIDLHRYVRRTLNAYHATRKDERVFSRLLYFEESARPTWWNAKIADASWGEVYGVHESKSGASEGAIVIAENGLALISKGVTTWIPYASITGWDELSKDPPATSLRLFTKSGDRFDLPLPEVGRAFAFVQFLGAAIDAHARAGARS